MKMQILLLALLLMALPASAQTAPPPMKTFTAGADIPALIAKAKAAQKSPNLNSTQPIASVGGTTVLLEYRSGLTPPTIHPGLAELVYVIAGDCTLVTGGKLIGAATPAPGATTVSGTGIEGAAPQKLTKGDFFMVPPDTPHQFQNVQGEFVIMSVHFPTAEKK